MQVKMQVQMPTVVPGPSNHALCIEQYPFHLWVDVRYCSIGLLSTCLFKQNFEVRCVPHCSEATGIMMVLRVTICQGVLRPSQRLRTNLAPALPVRQCVPARHLVTHSTIIIPPPSDPPYHTARHPHRKIRPDPIEQVKINNQTRFSR